MDILPVLSAMRASLFAVNMLGSDVSLARRLLYLQWLDLQLIGCFEIAC
jgi:hypothetical protein